MLNPMKRFVPRTEFDSPPYYRGKAEGKAEGSVEATAKALLRVLAARNLSPTEEQRQAVLSCRDQDQLDRWLDAAVTTPSLAALFSA